VQANALYSDQKANLNIFMAYLNHKDALVRDEALDGILNSTHLFSVIDRVLPYVTSHENGLFRRTLLGRVACLAGSDYMAAARDSDVSNFLDYRETISERKVQAIAQSAIIKERYARLATQPGRQHDEKLKEALNVKVSKILERAADYQELLEELRTRYGVPFVFEWDKKKGD
jgi:hypothetical protein